MREDEVLPDRAPLWAGAAKTQITPAIGGLAPKRHDGDVNGCA